MNQQSDTGAQPSPSEGQSRKLPTLVGVTAGVCNCSPGFMCDVHKRLAEAAKWFCRWCGAVNYSYGAMSDLCVKCGKES